MIGRLALVIALYAPLAKAAPRDITVGEGVTCDVCHTLREPAPAQMTRTPPR